MEQAYNRDNGREVSMKKNKFHPKGLIGNPEGMLMSMKSGESNSDVLRRWQVKDVKTRWAVYDDGLKIWFDGELVAKIHPSEFKHMVSDLALWLRHNDAEDQGDGKI